MAYTPVDWVDGTTPVNAANLDHMEQGIDDIDSRVATLESAPTPSSIEYENAWAAGTAYQPGDVVIHNGVQYLAVNPSTGSTPPATAASPPAMPVTGYGTVLPASPLNGEEYILVDSLTAPTYQWRLRWNAAGGTHKWEFVGGYPKTGTSSTETTVAVSGTVSKFGATLTVPRAGAYWHETTLLIGGSNFTAHITSMQLYGPTALGVSTMYTGAGASNFTTFHIVLRQALVLAGGELLEFGFTTGQPNSWTHYRSAQTLLPLRVA